MDTKNKENFRINNCPPSILLAGLISDPSLKLTEFSGSLWTPVTDCKWPKRYYAFCAEAEEKNGKAIACFCLWHWPYISTNHPKLELSQIMSNAAISIYETLNLIFLGELDETKPR